MKKIIPVLAYFFISALSPIRKNSAFIATIIFLLFFSPHKGFSQWQQTLGPGGGFSTGLYAKGDTLLTGNFENFSFYFIGPPQGTLYKSTDHAQLWKRDSTGFYGKPISLTGSGSTIFAATLTDGIFRSTEVIMKQELKR